MGKGRTSKSNKFLITSILSIFALIFFVIYFVGNDDVRTPPTLSRSLEIEINPEDIRSRAASIVKYRKEYEKENFIVHPATESHCSQLTQQQQVCISLKLFNQFDHH